MKNAVILHGTTFSETDPTINTNWFPWLKGELEERGYKVFLPELPDSIRPNPQKYTEFLFKNWDFNEETVVIGHSSGATACLWVAQELPELKVVSRLICVAPFYTGLDGMENFFDIASYKYNWKKISNSAKEIIVFYSDNDPYISEDEMKHIAKVTNAKGIYMPGQKHFSLGSFGEEYKKFPKLLEFI